MRVEVLADEPMALGKPKADRLLDGKNRSIWKLPCTKGTNLLVLCNSQAKRVQKMRLKLYKFNKVGHYVADDTLVINGSEYVLFSSLLEFLMYRYRFFPEIRTFHFF